ncbi:MAG: aldehyde dehydrogenase family protein, partial [Deltaproteobacteria bacterium]
MAIVTPVETPPGVRRRLRLGSPVTLEPVGEIEVQGAEDVRAAVARARAAQPAWAARSIEDRARVVLRALAILLERQDAFVEVVLRETGKARSEALLMEIFAGCDALHYYAKRTARFLRPERKRLHGVMALAKKLRIVYRPLGVVGVISPWNGPFILSLNPTVQAL